MLIAEFINKELEKGSEPRDIADTIGVTPGMISIWKKDENDFVPRLKIARLIREHYNVYIWPYSKEALDGERK